jgi:hypothetical protein
MMKASLLALAAVADSVLGVLVYLAIDFSCQPPFAVGALGVWTEYGALISGGVGAICVVVVGWAACVWINKSRMHVPGPSEIPPADVTFESRKKSRPLACLYRV